MGSGKKKIEIRKKEKESDRMVTFSKRRKGLFKKAADLRFLAGTHVAILVFSPAGHPYVDGDPLIELGSDDFDGRSGADCCSCLKYLLDINAEVDECGPVEELILMKNELEMMKKNLLAKKIGNNIF